METTQPNAYELLGQVRRNMKKAQLPQEQINEVLNEAKKWDYDHLLEVCAEWIIDDNLDNDFN